MSYNLYALFSITHGQYDFANAVYFVSSRVQN